MTPLIFNLGPTELIIILVIVLVLFGGSRLAGLGKSSGRAIREFKEETDALRGRDAKDAKDAKPAEPGEQVTTTETYNADGSVHKVTEHTEPVDAEVVDSDDPRRG